MAKKQPVTKLLEEATKAELAARKTPLTPGQVDEAEMRPRAARLQARADARKAASEGPVQKKALERTMEAIKKRRVLGGN